MFWKYILGLDCINLILSIVMLIVAWTISNSLLLTIVGLIAVIIFAKSLFRSIRQSR